MVLRLLCTILILHCLVSTITTHIIHTSADAIRGAQKLRQNVPSFEGLTLLFDSDPIVQFTQTNCVNPSKPSSTILCTPLLVTFLPSIFETKVFVQTAVPDLLFEISVFPSQDQYNQIIKGRHYEYSKPKFSKLKSSKKQQDDIPVDYQSPVFHPYISQKVPSPQVFGKQFFLSMATEFNHLYFISGKYNPNSDYTIMDLRRQNLEEIVNITSRPFASSFKILDYSYDFYQKRFYFGGVYTYSDPSIYRFNYDNNMVDFSRIMINCFMNFPSSTSYISIEDMFFTDLEYGTPTKIGDLHRYRLFVVGSNNVEYQDRSASRIVNINVNSVSDSYFFDVFPPKGLYIRKLLYSPFNDNILYTICWQNNYSPFETEAVFMILKLNATNGEMLQHFSFGKYDRCETDYNNFEFFFGYGHTSVIFAMAHDIFKFDVDSLQIMEQITFPTEEVIRFVIHNPIVENEFIVLTSLSQEKNGTLFNMYYFRDGYDLRLQDTTERKDFSFWLLLFSMINLGIVGVIVLFGIVTCIFCLFQNMAAKLFVRKILGLENDVPNTNSTTQQHYASLEITS